MSYASNTVLIFTHKKQRRRSPFSFTVMWYEKIVTDYTV
jgi:hypothetical protein